MNELSVYILNLLGKHGYAIVPGFGGFVSRHVPSKITEGGRVIKSPSSEIGFNENLKANDGLLIQSYMEKSGISYPAAEKKVRSLVVDLNEKLHGEGRVIFDGIGVVSLTIRGSVVFSGKSTASFDTSLYGLEDVHVRLLSELSRPVIATAKERGKTKSVQFGIYMQYVAACVAVIVLYFLSSVSIDNSSLHRYDNMASVLPSMNLFDGKDAETLKVFVEEEPELACESVNKESESADMAETESKPEVIKQNVKPESSFKAVSVKRYHIVVASLALDDDSDYVVESLKKEGYNGANALKGEGRIRIILDSFENFDDALREAESVRANTRFKDAWVLTRKL